AHLRIRSISRVASTDANIPLALGKEALTIGAGGDGGGAHSSREWFDCGNRDLGLKRILLALLALAGVQNYQLEVSTAKASAEVCCRVSSANCAFHRLSA